MEEYILYISLCLATLSFLLFLILNYRLSKTIKKYNYFMQGLGEQDVEKLMTYYLDDLDKLKNEVLGSMNERVQVLEKKIPQCVQNVGIVHYNAFDNVGNEMSFSAALMDEQKNGFVLTGIYSRDSSYVYSKEITRGTPQRELSREENEAVEQALNKKDN